MKKIRIKYSKLSIQMKTTLWFVFSSFIQRGISLIVTPIFTRLMSVSEFGEFNEFLSWQGLLTVIVTLYLPWGVFEQGLIKFENEKNEFTSSLESLLFLLVIIWFLIYLPFSSLFNSFTNLSINKMLAMFIMMWTSSVFAFWSATERVEYKYQRIVALTIIVAVLKPLMGIIFVNMFSDKVTARIWSLAIVELICYSGLFFEHLKNGKIIISKRIWKYAIKYNILLIPHFISQTLLNSADRIIISQYIGNEATGLYSLAYSLSLILTVFNTSILQAINPTIYKYIREKRFSGIPKITVPALIIVALLNLLLMLFAPEIIQIFAPKGYLNAIWAIPPISMSVYFIFLYNLFVPFEYYYEKTKFISIATFSGAILNVILNILYVPKYGFVAASYTTLLSYTLYAVSHYLVMQYVCLKNENIEVYSLKTLLAITSIFLLIGFLSLLLYNYLTYRYLFIFLIFIFALLNKNYFKKYYSNLNIRSNEV